MTNTKKAQTTPAFQKHQIIIFEHTASTRPEVGFIETLTNNQIKVVCEYAGGLRQLVTKKGMTPDALLRGIKAKPHDGTPVPALLQQFMDQKIAAANAAPAKKGDVVSYTHNGESCTGRVMRGGKRPLVSYSETQSLEIPVNELAPATLPQPDPELKAWAVSSWVSHGTGLDGEAMTAIVTRNGKPVLEVIDEGNGAPCSLGLHGTGTQDDLDTLEGDLKGYIKAHNLQMHEPVGVWAEYAWALQPTGMKFVDYVPEFRQTPNTPSL